MGFKNIIEREIESASLTTEFQTLCLAAENQGFSKIMIRNTDSTNRVVLRFDGDDTQLMTLEPSEKVVFGGVAQFSGKLIEAKLDTSIASSIRLNLIG